MADREYDGRRDEPDRTVPPEENYYGFDISSFDRQPRERRQNAYDDYIDIFSSDVRESGINPAEQYYSAGRRSADQDGAPRRDRPPAGKKHKKKKNPLIAAIAVLMCIVLLVTALTMPVLSKINYDKKEDNAYVSADELRSSSSVTNILLLGVDARSEEDDETSRSDTMMLISIDSANHCIKMTSFQRDTWIYIPCKDKSQRLNAACSYGGYSAVADTIEYNFGIKIDGYVVTDFEMFQVMVDSIGGVEIDVTEAEAKEVTNHQSRYGGVTLESGLHTLTGEQALAYCRIRKIDTDWKRTERQRTVMEKILSGIAKSGPISAYSTLNDVAPYIETSLTKSQIIKAGFKAISCVSGGFEQTSCPFDGTWKYTSKGGASVITMDVDDNKDKLIEFIYGE